MGLDRKVTRMHIYCHHLQMRPQVTDRAGVCICRREDSQDTVSTWGG